MNRHPSPARGAASVALALTLGLAAAVHGFDELPQPAPDGPRGQAPLDSPRALWDQVKQDSRNAWGEASETSREAWGKTRDESVRVWDEATDKETWRKAKEDSRSAWEATKSFTRQSWEKAKSAVTGAPAESNPN